jgi:CheY-like chemotaxis protein
MVSALICSPTDLEHELQDTLVFRDGFERHLARRADDALMLAVAARPGLVIIDSDLMEAPELVQSLRDDAATRSSSIVVIARGDFDPDEIELLEAGANAILRLPPSEEWTQRLQRLIDVPIRKQTRLAVDLKVETLATGAPLPAPGEAVNLSTRGMLLETRAALSAGDDVGLSFSLSDGRDDVHAGGRVVRLAGVSRFGVEFTELEDDTPPRIARFLETVDPS